MKGHVIMITRDKIAGFYYSREFIWILVGFGICLRLVQFLLNRALNGDEAVLAQSILNRSYSGLAGLLDYDQCAPLGFLMVEKFFTNVFGTSEYSLRLWPLICGIAAMAVFPVVARRVLTEGAVRLATFLFAISCYVIFYSSCVKQYSDDVLIALVLWYNAFYIIDHKPTLTNLCMFTLLGAVAVWFSHPAVFMLAGIGLCIFLWMWRRKDWFGLKVLVVVIGVWIASFMLSYFFILSKFDVPESILWHWSEAFVPFPPKNLKDLYWFIGALKELINNPGGLGSLSYFLIVCLIVGISRLFSSSKIKLCVLLSPIPVALLASGIKVYPFAERVILYLVPVLLIGVAEGIEQMRYNLSKASPALAGCFVVALFLSPVLKLSNIGRGAPFLTFEIKPVLSYIQNHIQEGDSIYLGGNSHRQMAYYSPRYGLERVDCVPKANVRDRIAHQERLDSLRSKSRVWVLFSHVGIYDGINEESFAKYYLFQHGNELDRCESYRASVYLFNFSESE
jgi:hypothetical protein